MTDVERPNRPFLEALRESPLVFDGAMGTQIQGFNLRASEFGGLEGANDLLTITRPDILQDIQTLNERATRGELDISAIKQS